MGQKTSPIGFRTGIRLNWQSTWFAPKANYGEFLIEDWKIRDYVEKKYNLNPPYSAVSKSEIARIRNEVKVTLYTARPGMVIGPRGAEVDKFREELESLINRKISVNVVEVKEPSLDAKLIAENIAQQLKKRSGHRRIMKMACESAMNAGALGVKVICGGRLSGSEIARNEVRKLGSIPLHTLDANVDFAMATSRTTYGAIGVKVWVYKGKFGEEIKPIIQTKRRRSGRGGGKSSPGRGRTAAATRRKKSGPAPAEPKSGTQAGGGQTETKQTDDNQEQKQS